MAAPLTALPSSKVPFQWSPPAAAAFKILKDRFTSSPILLMPDSERQFVVEVDASDVGVGAVLSQRSGTDHKFHPCAFFSQRLSPDHKNLEYIRSAKRLNSRQACWSLFFAHFNFTLSYRPGSRNVKPDALSHQFQRTEDSDEKPESILPTSCLVATLTWDIEERVRAATEGQPGPSSCPSNCLFVPPALRSDVLLWAHSSKLFCHPGV